MLCARDSNTNDREKLLARNISEVATELRMTDVSDFIAYIRLERFGNIDNLVNSATELYFKPNTLKFGQSADIQLKWAEPPVIILDMEFCYKNVQIFFRLFLHAMFASVNINYISLSKPTSNAKNNTLIISDAIVSARDFKSISMAGDALAGY